MATKSGWKQFTKLCIHCKTDKQFDELMDLFMTQDERDQMEMRVLIVRELVKGRMTQREIASDLGISIAKITRGSNALKTVSNRIRNFIKDRLK